MKRILLFGRGFVGTEIARQLKVLKADYHAVGSDCDPIRTIREIRPHYIINAAGYGGGKNIDDCEHYRERTLAANVELPVKLADFCYRKFIPWLHVSTACCWMGNRTKRDAPVFWTEEDRPTIDLDTQMYAGSKLLAERLIAGSFCTICRIRMPFVGFTHPRNLITKLIHYPMAMEGYNSLTYLPEAVSAMIALLGKGEYGTFHLTNPGYLTTEEMIDLIERYVKPKRPWPIVSQNQLLNPSMIVPRSTCIVSSAKLAGLGIKMTPVRTAFMKACKEYGRASKL